MHPDGPWRQVCRPQQLPDEQPALPHAFTQVRNAPKTSWSRLQHEAFEKLFEHYHIGLRAAYEALHCLLDRELALRRQIDVVVENGSSFVQQLPVDEPHECQGRIKAVSLLHEVKKFRQCNQLCRLTQEGRSKLLEVEETLRVVHALQLKQLGDIKTLEERIEDELVGFGTTTELEEKLEQLQADALKLASSLREHYQQRTGILHGLVDANNEKHQQGAAAAESAMKKLSKYRAHGRRLVAAAIQKSKHKPAQRAIPLPWKKLVSFEDFARNNLILKKLFKEPCLPPPSRLRITRTQYNLLRRLRDEHERSEELRSTEVHQDIVKAVDAGQQFLAQLQTQRSRIMPAKHLDPRIEPFLVKLKGVRSKLHSLRMTLRKCARPELAATIQTLTQVLDLYACHLKYLRRYTLVVLLVPSSAAHEVNASRLALTCYLALDIGVSDKELTITLQHCPELSGGEISNFVEQTSQTLDLLLQSVGWLAKCFNVVSRELETEVNERSLFMARKLGEVVCYLNLSRYSFELGVRASKTNKLVAHATKRHLRVREHLEQVRGMFFDLADIKFAERMHACQVRDAGRFGLFPDIDALLQRDRQRRHMRRFGNIAAILGEEHLKVDALNMKCFVLTFADPDRPCQLIEDVELLPSPPLSRDATPQAPRPEQQEQHAAPSDFVLPLESGAVMPRALLSETIPTEWHAAVAEDDALEDSHMGSPVSSKDDPSTALQLVKLRLQQLLQEEAA